MIKTQYVAQKKNIYLHIYKYNKSKQMIMTQYIAEYIYTAT